MRFPSSTTDAIIDRKLVHSTTTHLSPVDDVGLTGTGLVVRSLVAECETHSPSADPVHTIPSLPSVSL